MLFFIFQSFFLISPEKNSKTSEVNQQSVLNLYIFHHFPKNLDRTITFKSVTLKNTQTECQKYIIFFQLNEYYLELVDKMKKIILEIKFYFFPTIRKITVGGFENQQLKKSGLKDQSTKYHISRCRSFETHLSPCVVFLS